MKCAIVLLVLVAAAASKPMDKRFLGHFVEKVEDAFHHVGDWFQGVWDKASAGFKNLWNSAKSEFDHIVHGIDFHGVVEKLVPLIDSNPTETACKATCVASANVIGLGVAGPLISRACDPACRAALGYLEEKAAQG